MTGGEEFALVINGDVIDRGPSNEGCLELVWRLQREAPPGHVRYHIGNHEMAMLLPEVVSWSMWYSGQQPRSVREDFYERILDGRLGVASAGYEYTYSHAGSLKPFDVSAVNDALKRVAQRLLSADGSERGDLQDEIVGRYPTIFGIGEDGGRGSGVGLLWLDLHTYPTTHHHRSSDTPDNPDPRGRGT